MGALERVVRDVAEQLPRVPALAVAMSSYPHVSPTTATGVTPTLARRDSYWRGTSPTSASPIVSSSCGWPRTEMGEATNATAGVIDTAAIKQSARCANGIATSRK